MKLNKKGFVSTAVLYSLLLLFLALILGLLALLSNRKQILDKLKGDIKSEINQIREYNYYENGTEIYYNPVTGKMCGDYKEENSKTGVTEGCLKWYIFNDDESKATINMILDHNTSGNVAWASLEDYVENGGTEEDYGENGNNDRGSLTATKRLTEDTKNWKNKARLISADEVAEITGATDKLNWSSQTASADAWFYLDGADGSDTKWQTQVATTEGSSKYAWLIENTYDCKKYGCNFEDNEQYPYGNNDGVYYIAGYWTSNSEANNTANAWYVGYYNRLNSLEVSRNTNWGVRPVITLSKKDMNDVQIETIYNYTGNQQLFVVPIDGNYKIELWGAQGGTTIGVDSNYSGNEGGKGGYVSGTIFLKQSDKLYAYIGKQGGVPTKRNDEDSRGYNGGGIGGYDTTCSEAYSGTCIKEAGSGGGASDIRLISGIWNNAESLNSRIMVAGAGGGASNWKNVKAGGNAGGLIGFSGTEYNAGTNSYINATGGTQVVGGSAANGGNTYLGSSGTFGIGGNSYYSYGGGGGGGYYGGGGGSLNSNVVGSGAGGSSYISGFIGSVAITSESSTTPKSGCTDGTSDINCSYHYSGYKFTDTIMKSGNETMPTHDGTSTMTGNSGNGYAKITYLGNE